MNFTTCSRTRYVTLTITALLSALTQAALFGIIITLAIIELPTARLQPFVLAASTLDGLLILALLAIVARLLGDSGAWTTFETILILFSSALSLTALVLSFFVLINSWSGYHLTTSDLGSSITACLIVAGIALSCFTLITQLITHFLLLLLVRSQSTYTSSMVDEEPSTATPSPKRFSVNLRALTTPMSPTRTQFAYSPSLNSLHSLKSSRQGSVSQVFGPLGSKTRLLIANSLHTHDSQSQYSRREPSLEIACRGEVGEMIDISEPYELPSSPVPRMNLSRTMLETIPGSRPVSPAKPLDGPYIYDNVMPEDFPLPDSPSLSRATSPVCSSPDAHIHTLPFPPMIGEFASQYHIHPLFRSDSPVPPPAATPGTIVTASPFAGHVVSPDLVMTRLHKSAHGSRATTPCLSPVPSIDMERVEIVPNFSRPGVSHRAGSLSPDMF